LDITPVLIEVDSTANAVTEPNARWIKISDAQTFGMPAPAVRLLAQLSAC
jgi:hypothetical protein